MGIALPHFDNMRKERQETVGDLLFVEVLLEVGDEDLVLDGEVFGELPGLVLVVKVDGEFLGEVSRVREDCVEVSGCVI